MSALLMFFAGIGLLLVGCMSALATYFLIERNTKEAAQTGNVLKLSMKIILNFVAVIVCGTLTISVFVGGLAMIDRGVKEWGALVEGKK